MQDEKAVTGQWGKINWLSGLSVECRTEEGYPTLKFSRSLDDRSVSGDILDTELKYRRPCL
jgi:hypothetical protein